MSPAFRARAMLYAPRTSCARPTIQPAMLYNIQKRGRVGKAAMAQREMHSNKEPSAGQIQIHTNCALLIALSPAQSHTYQISRISTNRRPINMSIIGQIIGPTNFQFLFAGDI